MSDSRQRCIVGIALLVLIGAPWGCGDDGGDGGSTPVGVIAIGHSALTGENSDPSRPGKPAKENSWATGSNPEVNSVYRRLVAVHPDTEGHVANLAQGGAPASNLSAQAEAALEEVPTPELVIIETIDADIRCDGTDDTHVPEFGRSVAEALALIAEASPASHILLVGQPGRPATEIQTIPPEDRAALGGTGMCDGFDPEGNINEARLATLTATIESYEAEQARVCAAVPLCSTDDGALTAFVPDPNLRSPDGNHNTVAGHARLAELIWPVVERQLEL